MKSFVTLSLVILYASLALCRPQTVQIERQDLLHLQRSVSKEHPRGSVEETKKILQEIERINLELGYKRRMTLAFPRVASGEGYFYPRQQFRPEFLTKPRDNFNRMNNRRAIYPFNNQNYYYPTPYLQAPINARSQSFNANYYPVLYAPVNSLPYGNFKDEDAADGSIRLGTIVVLPAEERGAKSVNEDKVKSEKKAEKVKPVKDESSLIDDIVNYVPDALGLTDDDEDERQEAKPVVTRLPTIKNDKFLNLAVKKHPQEEDEDEDRKLVFITPPAKNNVNRAFNFSNQIEKLQGLKNFTNPIEKLQNLTNRFSINYNGNSNHGKEVEMETSTPSAEDLEELAEDKLDDKEDEKSPFGFAFGPQQQLQTYKEGGLIIQRLKVRRGGIAIAGPGGVATAGSGGTAIVGPNGIAFTHPRGLAIGGPGARIYAVPESTDLENLALTHAARNLNLEGMLVARGPVVYYNEE